jgi:ferric-dicitrate binding protein FerR (iron transport regulator)
MFVAAVIAAALPMAAFAAATVESLKGIAQAGGTALTKGARLVAPTAISTDPGAQVFLKFDDGMQIVLDENSLLRIVDFRHTDSGVTDRAVFDLLRGAARVVTGTVAKDNPKQFFFRTPQTQLTVESAGADFTVVLVNPAYISVKAGTVVSSNAWGTAPLGAGSTSVVAGSATAPAAISAAAMPASASSAMSGLGVAAVGTPVGGGAATGVATTAAGTGGVSFGVTAILVGIGLGVAAVAGMDDEPSTAATTTHH